MLANIEIMREDGTPESVAFKVTGTTSIRYKQLFGRELLGDITSIIQDIGTGQLASLTRGDEEKSGVSTEELIETNPEILQALVSIVSSGHLNTINQMAYIMHEQAAGTDMSTINMSSYFDWLDQYDNMSFLNSAMDFIGLYFGNRVTSSDVKKNPAPPTGK